MVGDTLHKEVKVLAQIWVGNDHCAEDDGDGREGSKNDGLLLL